MKFKKDETGKLEKAVQWCIKKYRPDLECLSFLCVWRDKEKFHEGKLIEAEVSKISNANRDVFGYDVMLLVDINNYKSLSKEEKQKLIFHELQHVVVEYELSDKKKDDGEVDDATPQMLFEDMLADNEPIGEPKRDKQDRIIFKIRPHNVEIARFREELLMYGLSPDEEALRLFLNHVKKTVGYTKE